MELNWKTWTAFKHLLWFLPAKASCSNVNFINMYDNGQNLNVSNLLALLLKLCVRLSTLDKLKGSKVEVEQIALQHETIWARDTITKFDNNFFHSKNFYHALSLLPILLVRTPHTVKGHSEHNWPVKYAAHWPGAWILFKRTARQLLVGQKWVSRPKACWLELYFSGGVFRGRIHLSEGLVGKETSTRDCTRDHSFCNLR